MASVVPEGAADRSAGDPVLDAAFSEMASESGFDPSAELDVDPGSANASQTDGAGRAEKPAASPAATGDSASGQQAAAAKPGQSGSQATPTEGAGSAGQPAADPFQGTESFKYTTDGQPQSLVWAHRVPGEGVIVTEEEVPHFQALVERAATLDRVTREITDQNSTYERLSTWTTPGSDGKDQTLSGREGLEAMRAGYARTSAALAVADAILGDPAKLVSLLAKDGQGNIVVDPQALETLTMRAQLAADQAEKRERAQFGTLRAPASSGSGSPSSYSSEAPKIIEQAAGIQAKELTADDRQLLTGQIDRYIRAVTESDRKLNPLLKLGAPIVDAEYARIVQHLARQRAGESKRAKDAEAAGKHNAGMDKGLDKGRQAKPAAKPAAKPVTPQPQGRKRPDWDTPLQDVLTEMGIT